MDSVKAELLAEQLHGSELGGWTVDRLIDHGKSAAVFLGHKSGQPAAVKVFDTELIERYGDATQLERIARELELKGKSHENLVCIYDGGFDKERNLYFIVMEFLDGENLRKSLDKIDNDQIISYVEQLASAAKFLEELGLVHRDIKPENIVLLDERRRLVLLDFGVIRPIKGSSITDPEGIHAFVGTLQYSSPEFLLRDEKQDLDGWRALTFYQIGAVLHDLITRKPIFEQFANPYAKLVNAVQNERPIIVNRDVNPRLIQLAERCLLKNPVTRLKVVKWNDFFELDSDGAWTAKDRVLERLATVRAQAGEASKLLTNSSRQQRQMRQNVSTLLKSTATAARTSVPGLPPIKHSRCQSDENCDILDFQKRPEGLPHGLAVRLCVEVIDPQEAVINCTGCAYFPDRKDGPADCRDTPPWFQGPLDNVALTKAFESFLFQAIEWCMQISPGVETTSGEVFAWAGD